MITSNTEVRKLGITELSSLARLLSPNAWKIVMASITTPDSSETRFSSEDIKLIEEAARIQRRSSAEIFLQEWATMGRRRPTISTVMELLITANLLKAADYLAVDVLRGQRPERPQCGPQRDINVSEFLNELSAVESNSDSNSTNGGFCNRSTAQVELNNVEYPAIFSAQNVKEDIKVFEINDCEKKEWNIRDSSWKHPETKSDLIEFSRSTSNIREVDSDLMDFNPSNCFPKLKQSSFNSSNLSNETNQEEKGQVPAELNSSELPICLKKAFTKDSSSLSYRTTSSVDSLVETTSNVSSIMANNLYLPALSKIFPNNEVEIEENQVIEDDEGAGASANTGELPLTVVELFKQ